MTTPVTYEVGNLNRIDQDSKMRWRGMDAWYSGEALFLLQGFEPIHHEQGVLQAAERAFPREYNLLLRAIQSKAFPFREVTQANQKEFVASPQNWIKWASGKEMLNAIWRIHLLPADYARWSEVSSWRLVEGIFLILGYEPVEKFHPPTWCSQLADQEAAEKISALYDLAKRSMDANELQIVAQRTLPNDAAGAYINRTIVPATFIRWIRGRGCKVPEALSSFLNDPLPEATNTSAAKFNGGLQHFINKIVNELDKPTYGALWNYLRMEKADAKQTSYEPIEGFDPRCSDVYIDGDTLCWTDNQGREQSRKKRSLEPYFRRTKGKK